MLNLPIYISLIFLLTVLLAICLLWIVTNKSKNALIIVAFWLALQGGLSISGFYTQTLVTPPRFPLLLLPPTIFILTLFASARGRRWLDSCDTRKIYLVHVLRVPVEIVLYLLYMQAAVPELMTFSNGNYDILSGVTAPIVYYFGIVKNKLSKWILLVWNVACLGLLTNIIYRAVFSAPLPFQRLGFEQPNIGILYFPFTWLPAFVVPFVLFAHLVAIRQIIKNPDHDHDHHSN